jgi:uncharacterized membrane protein YciS (DUF1049 family)
LIEFIQAQFFWIGKLLQFSLFFAGILVILKLLFVPRNRWRIHLRGWHSKRLLLKGCGIRAPPEVYLAYRRSLLFLLSALGGVVYLLEQWRLLSSLLCWYTLFALGLVIGLAACDRMWLQSIRRYRTDRIRREIVAIISQLLYYTGSRLHLHGKLMKCLTLTRYIRADMGLLLNEWYHDADTALKRFKERLGTDEAYGFAESMRSLRLNESQDIYDLLREVVQDYKAQIELAKDSRKETTSYLLFVLAGLPILYTFQVFIYPWVQEASKLFDSLNP